MFAFHIYFRTYCNTYNTPGDPSDWQLH